jgi:hypothetical protein
MVCPRCGCRSVCIERTAGRKDLVCSDCGYLMNEEIRAARSGLQWWELAISILLISLFLLPFAVSTFRDQMKTRRPHPNPALQQQR